MQFRDAFASTGSTDALLDPADDTPVFRASEDLDGDFDFDFDLDDDDGDAVGARVALDAQRLLALVVELGRQWNGGRRKRRLGEGQSQADLAALPLATGARSYFSQV